MVAHNPSYVSTTFVSECPLGADIDQPLNCPIDIVPTGIGYEAPCKPTSTR